MHAGVLFLICKRTIVKKDAIDKSFEKKMYFIKNIKKLYAFSKKCNLVTSFNR